ncbi:WXG100 family type VII secretion target [Gordonia sp. ABSL1-1]|uniref:WXG100 family type VII secretion target n=1 Tax=Gordonia sp. ABSL1-1 TaxID=3053923 RepID=UPI00257450C5|nr:WXG100 family type VII secretion target [Gordonia sp. ABSL1-1]MDL9937738.1 WXG100 family type VII secretion target [Gordonia sp. ABSL1-1]
MDHVKVTPDQLRTAATHLDSTSDRLKAIVTGLNSTLGGLGAPWGGDEPGTNFATGGAGGGYLGQSKGVLEAMTGQYEFLTALSENMDGAADNLEQTDTV